MLTLLLADDSVTTQRVIALTFAEESFRVITVSDGQQAMDSMAAMRPDIVLAATSLPRTNGYELAEYMHGLATLRDVPVLLLSGAFESVDAALLKESGARGVIEKPLEPTAVISRVRELLGLKGTRATPPAGRLVTLADTPADHLAPPRAPAAPTDTRKSAASSWDDLRHETGLEPDARSVEGGTAGSGRDDYLDTLDAAFDSLDKQLAGRHPDLHPHRNPSPPLGQASGASDPRSPGRRPAPTSDGATTHSVFEVDTDWFADDKKAGESAARNQMVTDAREAIPARPAAAPGNPIFEVDDDWFAEGEKARDERRFQQRELAAEMGIHDVVLPESAAAPAAGPPVIAAPVVRVPVVPVPVPPAPAPVAPAAAAPAPTASPRPVLLTPSAPSVPAVTSSVADDFAALLAFEVGGPEPLAPATPPGVPAAARPSAPEISDAMLEQIAMRVADRLNAGPFGAHLRDAMTATVRDTVRSVVSETSERLVRDEIARVKARVEHDTQ